MQTLIDGVYGIALTAFIVFLGMSYRRIENYLLKKGGEKAIVITEILARNAVNAIEQISKEVGFTGEEKLSQAQLAVKKELDKYGIATPDTDLTLFIEAAVKHMNDTRKETTGHGNNK